MAAHIKEYTPDREGYEESFEDLEQVEPADKPAYSKVIVAICLLLILAFTVTQLVFMWNGKQLNDVQTACFYGCFGIEFASLAFVTRGKLKYVGGNPANKQMPHVEIEEDEDGKVPEQKIPD